jgi:hypothetical protein
MIDSRSKKTKKQDEYEEAHKLKNLVKVLDDDEVDFLDHVDRQRMEDDRRKRLEEAKELSEFRSQVAILREKELEQHIKHEIGLTEVPKQPSAIKNTDKVSIGSKRSSQTSLLAGIVKRKMHPSNEGQTPSKILKTEEKTAQGSQSSSTSSSSSDKDVIESVPYKGNLVCIGVLPGLASYSNSSDDEKSDSDHESSDTDDEVAQVKDLCGRRIMTDDMLTKKETK